MVTSARKKRSTSIQRKATQQSGATTARVNGTSALAMRSPAGSHAKVQTKLTVNTPGDRYEREADAVASAVTSSHSTVSAAQNPRGLGIQRQEKDAVQRMEEEAIQRMADESVQRMEEEAVQRQEDDPVQRQAAGSSVPSVSPSVAKTINNPGSGRPIDPNRRKRIEGVLNADLGSVRLHDDRRANQAATDLQAKAFTHGGNIFLSRAALATDTELLAHEATHTVQQGAAIQRQEDDSVQRQDDDSVQRMAEESVQRQEDDAVQRQENDAVQRQPAVTADGQAPGVQRLLPLLAVGAIAVVDYATDGGVRRTVKQGLWAAFKAVAPDALVELVEDISDAGGLFAYLKEKVFGTLEAIYDTVKSVLEVPQKIAELVKALLLIFGLSLKLVPALASGDKKKVFTGIRDIVLAMRTVVEIVWPGVRFVLKPISALVSGFLGIIRGILAGAKDVMNWVVGVFKKYIGGIIDTAGDAVEWVLDNMLDISVSLNTEAITNKVEEIVTDLTRALNNGVDAVDTFVARIDEMIDIESFDKIIEHIKTFLTNAASFADNMDSEGEDSGIIDKHAVLKGIAKAIESLFSIIGDGVVLVGVWISGSVGWVANKIAGVVGTIAAIPILPEWIENAINKVRDGIIALGNSAQATITAGASLIAAALGKLGQLAGWVAKIVVQVAMTIASNPLAAFTSLFGVLKKLWELVPAFIRNPVEKFIENQVKERIPLVAEFLAVAKLAGKILELVGTLIDDLVTQFALWPPLRKFFKALIKVIGFPIELVKQIISKAMSIFSAIVRNPIRFLRNIFRAIKAGFASFFKNIHKHLLKGVIDWLFAVARKNNIEPPKSLELSELFRFAFEVMGINEDLIFERLGKHKDVGKERAQKIRKVWKTLTGVWSWIVKLFTKGPKAIWEDIKAQLLELKDKLINNVLEWVMKEFVEAMLTKLISWLDPTGIMAIINSAIAIYRAVQSFIEHLKEMLQLINSVLDSIGEVVAGKIAKAAEFLEQNLVRALPIVIGFLANQFGMGDLGKRIGDMIKKVRAYVVMGLDWLIDKAVKAGGAILRGIKTTAAKVLAFFEKGFTMKGSGEKHTVRSELREGNKVEFLIASGTFNSLLHTISDVRDAYVDYFKAFDEARGAQLDKELTDLGHTLAASHTQKTLGRTTAVVANKFNKILAKYDIRSLHDTALKGFPPAHSPKYGTPATYGRATSMSVTLSVRSRRHMKGTTGGKNVTLGGMNVVSGYQAGHLLAASLGGSNTSSQNFVPMSKGTNTSRSGMVRFEDALRKALKSNAAATPPPYIIKYALSAKYEKDVSMYQQWLNTKFRGAAPTAADKLFQHARDNDDLDLQTVHAAIDGGNGQVEEATVSSELSAIKQQLALHFMPNKFVPDVQIEQGKDLTLPASQAFNNHQ